MAVIVTVRHIRIGGLCMAGVRDWAIEKGYNWSAFLDDGLPAEELERHNDELASTICAIARKEHDGR